MLTDGGASVVAGGGSPFVPPPQWLYASLAANPLVPVIENKAGLSYSFGLCWNLLSFMFDLANFVTIDKSWNLITTCFLLQRKRIKLASREQKIIIQLSSVCLLCLCTSVFSTLFFSDQEPSQLTHSQRRIRGGSSSVFSTVLISMVHTILSGAVCVCRIINHNVPRRRSCWWMMNRWHREPWTNVNVIQHRLKNI